MHYIYVIQTREFITLKLPVYKIGKTEQELTSSGRNKRMTGYPKDSIQIALFAVSNCHEAEKLLIKNLNLSDDIKVAKIGNEWFEGDIYTICQIALSVAMLFKTVQIEEDEYKEEEEEQPKIIIHKFQCKYCIKQCSKKSHINQHLESCKERYHTVRGLELQLNIQYPNNIQHTECRFCNVIYKEKSTLTNHKKKCKAKQKYKEKLELQVQEKYKEKIELQFKKKQNNMLLNNHIFKDFLSN